MEEGRVDGVYKGETIDTVMSAVGLDQGRPFTELRVSGQKGGLEGVEGRVGVVLWEWEVGRGVDLG